MDDILMEDEMPDFFDPNAKIADLPKCDQQARCQLEAKAEAVSAKFSEGESTVGEPFEGTFKPSDAMKDCSQEQYLTAEFTLNNLAATHVHATKSNELSQSYAANDETCQSISREGLRVQRRRKALAPNRPRKVSFSNEMTVGGVDRHRKADDEVVELNKLWDSCNGNLRRDMKKHAMERTGLKWLQIYKWFYDRKTREDKQSAECNHCGRLACSLAKTQQPIFSVVRKDGQEVCSAAIFQVVRQPSTSSKCGDL